MELVQTILGYACFAAAFAILTTAGFAAVAKMFR